ncbi:MSHA biogenesis protein MshK [Vibrio breoganii]|uniref:MSHA biogenesis protein MshK n=1 Tax=Vibrio breoganii TaxID=553239 RepID=UPI00080DC974|nr:MSHA biogenesis protein MshK [Vibrio breoganii]OCH73540.1 MSHA biogenesis protein MshK [Vibrio breoganii]PMG04025.1 MSHA biogenesis protein MshK [Vibrio breoganii]PML11761.1 MSHA biogenesis protein MshK [Vibrio breoganii]PML25880.1 MSHA biogenesis protein MshK [Vibrio breoganii]
MVKVIMMGLVLLVGGQTAYAAQDPTAPLGWYKKKSTVVAKARTYPLPTLQSIVCDEGSKCFAMLNDKILSDGQSVAGYEIRHISSERVIVARAGKIWRLELFNSDVRQ